MPIITSLSDLSTNPLLLSPAWPQLIVKFLVYIALFHIENIPNKLVKLEIGTTLFLEGRQK